MTNPETITPTPKAKVNEKPPKYRAGDNLNTFIKLYEITANLNGWETDAEKLAHIHSSFKGKLLDWAISRSWDTWASFKEALQEREEVVHKDDMYYLTKLYNTKRKNYSDLNKYILKFDDLVQTRKEVQRASASDPDVVDKDEYYVKVFIKNASPADLRRFLKGKEPTELTKAYKLARGFENEASSDEESSDSDSSSSSDESSDDSDSSLNDKKAKSKAKKKKHSMVKSSLPKIKERSSVKTALIALLEMQMKQQQPTQPLPQQTNLQRPMNPHYRCYNCKEPGHFDDSCPKPCKHCGSTDHKRYQCPRKPSRINNAALAQQNDATTSSGESSKPILFMSVPDKVQDFQDSLNNLNDADLLAMKRLRSEETKAKEDQRSKRAKKKADQQAERIIEIKELITENLDNGEPSSSASAVTSNVVDTSPKEACTPIDPMISTPVVDTKAATTQYQVLPDPLVGKTPVFKSKTATVIEELRKQKVFNLSYNDIIALSSKAHTEFRRTLVSKAALETQGPHDNSDLLLNQECVLPEGNHAPRVVAKLNGVSVNVILDTGCTPCIISYRVVQRLGLTDQLIPLPSTDEGGILVGDGRRVQSKGLIKSIPLELLPGCVRKVDALCLDVPVGTYEFLCGRVAMAEFGLCADLGTSSWFVRNGDQFEDLEVYHTAPSSDPTCYLVTVTPTPSSSEASKQPSISEPSTDEEKFTKLFKDIDENELLNEEQRKEIKTLILSRTEAFGIHYKDLTQTDLVKFHVDTGDAKPVYKRPYGNMSHSELESLKKELGEMLEAGTLIPAMHGNTEAPHSGWSFQVMYVPKKNGEKRLVTMFQDLNKVTVTDPWPLPNINHLLESFGDSQYLSSLDLLKGFNQIACDEATIPKLQIATPYGAFCYTVMPFGVRNGPSTFARAIYLALKDFDFCATYIDDNQVYSKSYQEHLQHLEKVFDRMIEVKMKLNPNKCVLFRNQLDFLGFQISTQGISPIPSKVDAIKLVPTPKDKTDVRAFINMAGFYRRHIDHFSDRTILMTSLLKKNVPFVWGPQEEQEFTALKESVANAVMLKYPNPKSPYAVYCDASDTGIAAVLCQTEPNGEDVPICFISRKLKPAEINYATVEKELLAIVYALFKYRRYLLDQTFTVYTDNMAVKHMFSKKEPNTRLQRWCLALQEYDFLIKHVPGTKNPSDFFSRYPLPASVGESGEEIMEQLFSNLFMMQLLEGLDYEDELKLLYQCLSGTLDLTFQGVERRKLEDKATRYRIGLDQHLYRLVGSKIDQRYVKIPFRGERTALLSEVHDGHGHFGVHSTWSVLYRNYWWPGVYQEMKEYLQSCHECQVFSPATYERNPHLGRSQNVLGIFQQFSIDFVGPLPVSKSGCKYILVCTEMFTRWPLAVATKAADAITAATFLYDEVFTRFGPITTILSDNGKHFANQVVKELVSLCQARHKFGTPYHPETQGMVEKLNHTLTTALKKLSYSHPRDWDTYIPTILYAYRVRAHEAIGISPYELLYGVVPLGIHEDPLLAFGKKLGFDRLLALPEMRSEVVDKQFKDIAASPPIDVVQFLPGTLVLYKNFSKTDKFSTNWKDVVYTVVSAFKNNTYLLANMTTGKLLKRRANGTHLRRYFTRVSSERCPLEDAPV